MDDRNMAKKTARREPLSYIHETLRPMAERIDSLKLDPRNAREHGEENLAAIAESLKRFGQLKPIVVSRKGRQIVAGNGMAMAAKRLKWTHLAVVFVEGDYELGFALADNRTAELATWDQPTLVALMMELHGQDEDLYDALHLADLTTSLEAELAAAAAAEETADELLAGAEDEQEKPEGDRQRHFCSLVYVDADLPALRKFLGLGRRDDLPEHLGARILDAIRAAAGVKGKGEGRKEKGEGKRGRKEAK